MKIFAKLIIGLTIFIAIFANFIANPKPIVLWGEHHIYFPILFTYNYTDFKVTHNASNGLEVDYKELSVDYHSINTLIPYAPNSINFKLQSPSLKHVLGTNSNGQDIASIIIYSVQGLLFLGVLSFGVSLLLAFIFGMIQGYYGGWVDIIMQRLYEICISVPIIYILILITNLIELNMAGLMLLFAVINWVTLVPLIRLRTLVLKQTEFITVLDNFSLSGFHIILRHIFPQIFIYIKDIIPLSFIAFIISLVSLQFLGGALDSILNMSLGGLIWEGQQYLNYPWIITAPCVTLCIILLALVIMFGFNDSSKKYHY